MWTGTTAIPAPVRVGGRVSRARRVSPILLLSGGFGSWLLHAQGIAYRVDPSSSLASLRQYADLWFS